MNKFDSAFKIAIVGLLAIVAYQQIGIKSELEKAVHLSAQIKERTSDLHGTHSVRIVIKEGEKIPVEIVEPVIKRGMLGNAVLVAPN